MHNINAKPRLYCNNNNCRANKPFLTFKLDKIMFDSVRTGQDQVEEGDQGQEVPHGGDDGANAAMALENREGSSKLLGNAAL